MTDVTQRGAIHFLSDTDLTVADPAEDVRGRDVVDSTGEKIGTVDDLALDDAENRVRFLRVAHGGFLGIGEDHFLVPVDAVTRIDENNVHVNRQRKDLGDVPGYRPDLAEKPDYYEGVYGWWGYGPYWAPGYAYPGYPGYVI